MPESHAAHVRSAVAEPASVTRSPAAQLVHAVHEGALLAVLNVPASHAAHVRSAVAEPASVTRSPAAQFVHAVHEAALLAVL